MRRRRHLLLQKLGMELKRLHEGLAPRDVVERGNLLKEYSVGLAKVRVYEYEGRGYYIVIEPELSDREEEAYYDALELLYFSARLRPDSDPREAIEDVLRVVAKRMKDKINV